MKRDLGALADHTFDVVVVGGGITGACVAHDATLRGLSVALVERHDFGGATSAASSKLLHGGIRYLQQARVDKVRESARERAHFHCIASHLTRWVPFLVPTQRGLLKGRAALRSGMWCYERLTAHADRTVRDPGKRPPKSTFQSRQDLARLIPALGARQDVTGAQVLWESHVRSTERLTLAFVKSAASNGAAVANYLAADDVLRVGGRVAGVRAVDGVTGQPVDVRARIVVNAAGPWISGLNERLRLGHLDTAVSGFSTGAHIVTRQLVDRFALALPTRRRSSTLVDRGGRHVFVIPWRGRSLIGTSDRPFHGPLDEVGPLEDDIRDLLGDVNAALPGLEVAEADVSHAFAGLYPLTAKALRSDVYQGTGDYQIIDHGRADGNDGVVSVLGAKYTTARRVAERATDVICAQLGLKTRPCRTATTPLMGGGIDDVTSFTSDAIAQYAGRLAPSSVEHLVQHYGTECHAVLSGQDAAVTAELLRPLDEDRESIGAEVVFGVDEEMAMTLGDVVFRRTGLGTVGDPGERCLRQVATIMATRLGWTSDRRDEEVRRTQTLFPIPAPTSGSGGKA